MTEDELLTVGQVAKRIGAHPETVRLWLKAGRIKGFKPGGYKLGWRIRATELDRFLAEREA
jgi:excisionase family DNA binding protein